MTGVAQQATDEATADFAYLRLRAALNRFGQAVDELAPDQLQEAEELARREQAIQSRVLASPEARAVVLTDGAVGDALDGVRQRYDDEAEFQADLERNGLDEDGLRAALHRELVAEAVLDQVGSRYEPVTDAEVTDYYEAHPDRFDQPEMRTVRHLLITINSDYPENQPEQVRQRLADIRAQVVADPSAFGALAAKYSECPSALHEGLVGTIPRGQLYSELDEVLFGLEQGEVSEPVESPMGLHLVLCEEVQPGGMPPLESVRQTIRDHLEEQRRQGAIREWLRGAGEKASHG